MKNKKEKGAKKEKKAYTYQKTTFTVADMTNKKDGGGKSSATKAAGEKGKE